MHQPALPKCSAPVPLDRWNSGVSHAVAVPVVSWDNMFSESIATSQQPIFGMATVTQVEREIQRLSVGNILARTAFRELKFSVTH